MNTNTAENGPLVTVLTPAYNEAKYIAECIESVLSQTYQNWEYIIVDNCSTDSTREIALRYAKEDYRIKVVNPATHLRQVQNFNFAVSQLSEKSKYCKFVQGDDLVFQHCLAEMVALAEKNPSVGVVSSYRLNGCEVLSDGLSYRSTVKSGREICRLQLLEGLFLFGTPTSVMFRSEILRGRNPCFAEASLHFDTEICYDILDKWDFGFVHQVLSFSRTQESAITSTTQRFNPNAIDYYICLKRYGRRYLDAIEYERELQQTEEAYYSDLGRLALRRWDKSFWRYQQEGLRLVDCSISKRRLAKHIMLEFVRLLGNPERSLRRLLGKSKKAYGRGLTS